MSTSPISWGITETWFNGQIEVNTADKQIKYAKTFDLDAIALKVNGVFDYDKNVPYVGFKVLTKLVRSAAGDSSGFSVCKTISQNIGPLTLSADIASSVALGEQTYNPSKKSMESSPAQVEFNAAGYPGGVNPNAQTSSRCTRATADWVARTAPPRAGRRGRVFIHTRDSPR